MRHLNSSIYVDWLDPSMPARTCGRTAENIKENIKKYDKFILVATEGAIASKWCNWELGFGDVRIDSDGQIWETIWDVGNLVYDVGAAVYHHVTGDHETAKSHWIDAGADAAATLIPFVPAGTTKIVKGAKVVKGLDKASDAAKVSDKATDVAKGIDRAADASHAKELIKKGRSGRQSRLKELGDDPKLGKADRGWIKLERNQIERGKRSNIRNPKGKVLAHPRGKEAAKGHSYKESQLQLESNHKLQHKQHDNNGRKNKPK